MLVCFEKKIEKFEEISKILLTILKVLENFNKIYTIMYAFHCLFVFQRKTLYINCVHNRIFPKIWGAKCITAPPPRVKSGGPWPPGPPCGGPHALQSS